MTKLLDAAKAVVARWDDISLGELLVVKTEVEALRAAIAEEEARIAAKAERAKNHSGKFPYGPWRYDPRGQMIWSEQVEALMICQIRGTGYYQYLPGGGEAEQDAVGELLASLPDIMAERDELRAKLAAIEAASAEPVAWLVRFWRTTGIDRLCVFRRDDAERQVARQLIEEVTPLYDHPAPLPAYTPMTDEDLWKIWESQSTVYTAIRAIEQAVLARLGVGS